MNPSSSIAGAVVAGFALAAVLMLGLQPTVFNALALARWLHVLSGVMWIGLLYYFNVAQIPALAAAAADAGGPGAAGITKYVVLRALRWFRFAALATWLTGAWYLGEGFTNAFSLGHLGQDPYGLTIGIGAWLGTIMVLNVWVFIWPAQKKVLGLTSASEADRVRARRTALLASRLNFVLSVPMLACMAAAGHGATYGFAF